MRKGINLLLYLFLLVAFFASCTREYSFEGASLGIRHKDTIHPPAGGGPSICPACIGNDVFIENKWSLHIGGLLYCGKIDTIIIAPSRSGFTLFGPSSCSVDSGMVITVNLAGEHLNHNITNYSSSTNGFYYYDKVTPSYVAISVTGIPFFVTVESYDHTTKILTGSFYGITALANGGSIPIGAGKFRVKAI